MNVNIARGLAAGRRDAQEKSLLLQSNYYKTTKRCSTCDTVIPYDKRRNLFCSHRCAASENNKGIRRNGVTRGTCIVCGGEKSSAKRKFCGTVCANKHRRTETVTKIENGEYHYTYGSADNPVRRYLIEARGYRCEECGLTEWGNQKIPLNMHHIDGNATNNKPKNLKLLCLNCHGLTSNFGNKNKKSTRIKRYGK